MPTSIHTYQKYLNPSGDPVPLINVTVLWLLSMKPDINVPSKSNKQETFLNFFFVGILSATDEKIRIRIRTKMARIHNTALNYDTKLRTLTYSPPCCNLLVLYRYLLYWERPALDHNLFWQDAKDKVLQPYHFLGQLSVSCPVNHRLTLFEVRYSICDSFVS